jgi:hypothetical protein
MTFLIRTWGNVWKLIQREPNELLSPDDIRKDVSNHHLFNVELDEEQAEQAEKYIHRLELAHKALSKLLTPGAK